MNRRKSNFRLECQIPYLKVKAPTLLDVLTLKTALEYHKKSPKQRVESNFFKLMTLYNTFIIGGMGKRAWNSGFTGGMGKRAWNSGFNGGMGKRAWNSGFTGTDTE